ncbi:PLD nuclease N-terminal domain-containing protein [Knoellia sp. p5-6-4]|uniref:PLD nuclease N-terminal domain-containing protein n=1 Tax=unclassified Knoellia TaxID=2618719 RepID=UPI0023D98C2F|nr:PLD nuclease N-terminal domain-containing protein [Knoellia sp. p5-6-4]MDF2144919.1 PLD nuclease N-terminal domain-containing protein [Knoellia sp. p5-6-4]
MLIRGGVGVGIILFAVWVYCLLDVIMTDEHRVRSLSKISWILIVLFTFEVGAIAWLVAGRPRSAARERRDAGERSVDPTDAAAGDDGHGGDVEN